MAERLVWIKDTTSDPMELTCGHSTEGNGSPTPYTHQPPRQGDEWYCAMCALQIVSALDQEIALVEEQLERRK
jgi:hypothetical protein